MRHLCIPLLVRVPQVGNRCFRALAGFVILFSKRLFLSQDFWFTIQTESGFVVHEQKQSLKSQDLWSTIGNKSMDFQYKSTGTRFTYMIPVTLKFYHFLNNEWIIPKDFSKKYYSGSRVIVSLWDREKLISITEWC